MNYLENNIYDLAGLKWTGEMPNHSDSYVDKKRYELSKKKIKYYTAEDLRFALSLNICNKYLLPIALDFLKKDLFVSGDLYEGDLLYAVLSMDKTYWIKNKEHKEEMQNILQSNKELIENYYGPRKLKRAIAEFL